MKKLITFMMMFGLILVSTLAMAAEAPEAEASSAPAQANVQEKDPINNSLLGSLMARSGNAFAELTPEQQARVQEIVKGMKERQALKGKE
jgi:hypothetical protein